MADADLSDGRLVGHLPEHLQLKILSLIAAPATSAAAPPASAASTPSKRPDPALPPPSEIDDSEVAWVQGLASRLLAHGYAWQDEMVPSAAGLLGAATSLPSGSLAPAGMGASVLKWKDTTARGDRIAWVPLSKPAAGSGSPSDPFRDLRASAGFNELRRTLGRLVIALNRDAAEQAAAEGRSADILRVPEKVMLAHYPEGGRYVRHSDVSPAVAHRRVTAILYLNDDWQPAHGGQLVLYPPGQPSSSERRVAPRLGRLLVFRSSIEHEVSATRRPRWALTAWLSIAKSTAAATAATASASADTAAAAVPPEATAAGSQVNARDFPASAPLSPAAILQFATMMAAPSKASATPLNALAQPPQPPPTPTEGKRLLSGAEADGVGTAVTMGDDATRDHQPPMASTATIFHHLPPPSTIFVSVASYRDPEAPFTLESLFEQAEHPERVHIGVCFQCDDAEDGDCYDLSRLQPGWARNVRVLRMPWQRARGPVWARYLIQQQLFHDEDYFLQIDSHTRVSRHWDSELIRMLGRCASPMPVLTTYPLPYDGVGAAARPSTESRLTVLCTRAAADGAFGGDGMLRFRARLLRDAPSTPTPTPFWAAGFHFSAGAVVRAVPYDPHLPFLFFGEELSMAVRMWTRGYDLFAPDQHVVFHYWARSYRTTFWEVPGGAKLKAEAQARVWRLLQGRALDHTAVSIPSSDGMGLVTTAATASAHDDAEVVVVAQDVSTSPKGEEEAVPPKVPLELVAPAKARLKQAQRLEARAATTAEEAEDERSTAERALAELEARDGCLWEGARAKSRALEAAAAAEHAAKARVEASAAAEKATREHAAAVAAAAAAKTAAAAQTAAVNAAAAAETATEMPLHKEEQAEMPPEAQAAPGPGDCIWGVGNVRTLAMYERFAGVDFSNKRVTPQAERGGLRSEDCFWDRFACLHAMVAHAERQQDDMQKTAGEEEESEPSPAAAAAVAVLD